MVGYSTVVNLAHKAGINEDVKATPAMAIGAYDATPLEMAGAWTIFANHGVRVQPSFVSLVKEPNGKVLLDQKPVTKTVLDPRVAYLVVNMLEEVMRTGTAAGVRARGFTAPAAGKTGTDPTNGWFAGFTSDLLCLVWVGFDDNRKLDLEGAHSALPIWTEFMKRALENRALRGCQALRGPGWRRDGHHRSRIRHAGESAVSRAGPGSLHRRNRAGRHLPVAWRQRRSYDGIGMGRG